MSSVAGLYAYPATVAENALLVLLGRRRGWRVKESRRPAIHRSGQGVASVTAASSESRGHSLRQMSSPSTPQIRHTLGIGDTANEANEANVADYAIELDTRRALLQRGRTGHVHDAVDANPHARVHSLGEPDGEEGDSAGPLFEDPLSRLGVSSGEAEQGVPGGHHGTAQHRGLGEARPSGIATRPVSRKP
ncbi:hypothetical protein DL764_004484 [Monosporascus ibericus]|uniref:Uncharacterized protein n=1 Tax=Monosporascus ibericus TaxID=155417 RepID=A0A4Q4TFT5_9PEZI|nr:hypothetical protein DL764_004484 [Monosporascus ibericus]